MFKLVLLSLKKKKNIYIYIYTYTHTHIYIYTHAYTHTFASKRNMTKLESVISSRSLGGPGFTWDPLGRLPRLGLDPELVS